MRTRSIAFVLLLLGGILVIWNVNRGPVGPDGARSGPTGVGREAVASDGQSKPAGGSGESTPADKAADGLPDSAGDASLPSSKATRRETVASPDGVRRTVVDPMASWPELPAWPEGLRLFAEVDTATRRYVNLRPDTVGEMPRIRAEATEQIAIRISIPEADPGEKIHVELPNGGRFADSDRIGRILYLDDKRGLSINCITDEARGHCNVKIMHRGNSRSLPIWVGDLD
jgi:hypothetical protein